MENNFDKVWKLYDIRTKEGLENLAKNDGVIFLLIYVKENNFNKLFELEKFSKEDLQNLAKNNEVVSLLTEVKEDNFNKVWNLYNISTVANLQELAKNNEVVFLLTEAREDNFNKVWDLYNISTVTNLQELAEDNEIISLLGVDEEKFNRLWELYDIKTVEDLQNLASKWWLINFIREIDIDIINRIINFNPNKKGKCLEELVDEKKIEHIKTFYHYAYIFKKRDLINLKNLRKTSTNTYNIDIWSDVNTISCCPKNEKHNLNILLWESKEYLPVYIWQKIIWIVKKDWEKSFLSFEDVYDKKWNLIFVKWFIYNLEIDWTMIEMYKYCTRCNQWIWTSELPVSYYSFRSGNMFNCSAVGR